MHGSLYVCGKTHVSGKTHVEAALIFSLHSSRFATDTIIFFRKTKWTSLPVSKMASAHGAADNHIICRFNWKYKSQRARHYSQLWYTPCRLMHDDDDTLEMWRVTRVTFKYHGTPENLIGASTTHLNSCPRILPGKITSSIVSILLWIILAAFFSVVIFSSWQSVAQLMLLFPLMQVMCCIPTFRSCTHIICGV